jgi:signal transduction histidine kinase
VRYWQSFRLVRTENAPDYYIFTESSLAGIDALFASRILSAYYWLIGLMSVVLILIIRHVRLIDYSYLYRETKKANEMKDLYTNMIAHELRAPLTAMRGYASMIRENESIGSDVRAQGKQIEDAAGRLVVVVSDLLDVARIQSGNMKIERVETDITNLISEIVAAQKPLAESKHISLTRDGCLNPLFIKTDGKRLYQVLTNLISNAIKYTPQGGITVTLTDLVDRVEVRVKDTGMGISSQDQQKLFAPFFRVETPEVASITGTGLGMWVTKQLVELMRGSIGVESIKGVGTHVVVTFTK